MASGETMEGTMDGKERGEEVRSTRKAQGLTQTQLAQRSGLKERTIRYMEAGKSVTPATERAVYKALGMDSPVVWPDDVAAFLQMVGFRLTSVSGEERLELIDAVTRMLIGR